MDLILWRHAQAEDLSLDCQTIMAAQSGGGVDITIDPERDLARCLTAKGRRQADRMASWLDAKLPEAARILVSPAQRTQQTALALGRPFKTVKALHPQASVDDVLQAARWPHAKEPVVIVGHQPTLGLLAARLVSGHDQAWAIKKGAVWWLRSRERDGLMQVTLHAVMAPDML